MGLSRAYPRKTNQIHKSLPGAGAIGSSITATSMAIEQQGRIMCFKTEERELEFRIVISVLGPTNSSSHPVARDPGSRYQGTKLKWKEDTPSIAYGTEREDTPVLNTLNRFLGATSRLHLGHGYPANQHIRVELL